MSNFKREFKDISKKSNLIIDIWIRLLMPAFLLYICISYINENCLNMMGSCKHNMPNLQAARHFVLSTVGTRVRAVLLCTCFAHFPPWFSADWPRRVLGAQNKGRCRGHLSCRIHVQYLLPLCTCAGPHSGGSNGGGMQCDAGWRGGHGFCLNPACPRGLACGRIMLWISKWRYQKKHVFLLGPVANNNNNDNSPVIIISPLTLCVP